MGPRRPGGKAIRVLLVERMRLLREAFHMVLSAEEDLDVVAAIGRMDEVVRFARKVQPDVVIIDVDPSGGSGPAAVQELTESLRGYAVLVLADPDSPCAAWAAFDTNARGFVSKDTAPSKLAESVRRVAMGERVIDPTLAVAALCAPHNPLTGREREVLGLIALGLPSAEIADRVCLTRGTESNYISMIIHKAGARNRLEAVRIAEESGWLAESGRHAPTRSR